MSDEQLSLFDFGYNEKGDYVNFKEVEKEEEKRIKLNEEVNQKLIDEWLNKKQPSEVFNERKIIATAFRYYGEPIDFEYVKKKVEKIMGTRCFHYYNLETLMSIQSYVDGDTMKIMFENSKTGHYLMLNYHMEEDQLNDILRGTKTIGFPACLIDVFDKNGDIIYQYACDDHYKEDIRQIVICNEWHALDVGIPILDHIKKPKLFCDIRVRLPNLIKNLKKHYKEMC